MIDSNTKIDRPYLILCEGRDEERFINAYLKSGCLSNNPKRANEIKVINFGGNSELRKSVQLLKVLDGFSQVKAICVIRDAEGNAEKARNQIITAFKANGFDSPNNPGEWTDGEIKTGFLLFPSFNKELSDGALEDLCLSILAEENSDEIMCEINNFIESLKEKFGREYPKIFKTKLHTYFSVTDDFVGMKVGEAADAKAFNWHSPKLAGIKQMYDTLFSMTEDETEAETE